MSSKRVGIDGRLVMFDSHFLQKESPSMGYDFLTNSTKENIFIRNQTTALNWQTTIYVHVRMILMIVNKKLCNPSKRGTTFFVGNDVLNVL